MEPAFPFPLAQEKKSLYKAYIQDGYFLRPLGYIIPVDQQSADYAQHKAEFPTMVYIPFMNGTHALVLVKRRRKSTMPANRGNRLGTEPDGEPSSVRVGYARILN